MNKKAFTLAELLGVIVILGIIGTIAVTAIDRNIKNSRYQTCLTQEQNLIEGAKTLITEHPEVLPSAGHSKKWWNIKRLYYRKWLYRRRYGKSND